MQLAPFKKKTTMTNDELIQAFPECERIHREDIAECVISAMEEERFYSEATNKIYRKAHELYPYCGGRYDEENQEQNAHRNYFQGDWRNGKRSPFGDWLNAFEEEFLARHGLVHTKEEACRIVADEWVRMIFGTHIQDNGDDSESGAFGMMLGTFVKDNATRKYGEEVSKKAHEMLKRYYMNDCVGEGFKFPHPLHCDYGPDQALFDILVKSGVSERDADLICPWKTGIVIDPKDNSVCIRGYRTAKYM